MHVRIMLQITGDDGISGAVDEIAAFDKETERPEQVGLSLAEGKSLLAAIQKRNRSGSGRVLDESAPLLR